MKIFCRSLWTGLMLILLASAPLRAAETVTITNASQLATYIANFNSGESYVLIVNGTIELDSDLPEIKGTGSNSLEIQTTSTGTIDGKGKCRGLYINTGNDTDTSVSVTGVTIQNCIALGGNGGSGYVAGGGGMGAGGAVYVASGQNIVLQDVTTIGNGVKGGSGGNVLQESNTYGGGGGLGGNGGSGAIGDQEIYPNGSAGSGGGRSTTADGTNTGYKAAAGGENASAHYDYDESTTGVIGGGGAYGGGGGASADYIGGNGGIGGGAGAGETKSGSGGFGGGGAGGVDTTKAGLGGAFAGNGGYVPDSTYSNGSTITGGGTGGGGAGLGGALYVESGAKVAISYTKDTTLSNNYAMGGAAGISLITEENGGATAGQGIGGGYFLKSTLDLNIDNEAVFTVDNDIYGYDGADLNLAGDGTLELNSQLAVNGTVSVDGGLLVNAGTDGSFSLNTALNIKNGSLVMDSNQTIRSLEGSSDADIDLNGHRLTINKGYVGTDNIVTYAGTIYSSNDEKAGELAKTGAGILRLTGDNSDSSFTTTINGGSIIVGSDSALGTGDIKYIRTDLTDSSSALIFSGSRELDNNIILSANKGEFRLGTETASSDNRVTLNGQITQTGNSDGIIRVDFSNQYQTLALTNTGVDTSKGTWSHNTENYFKELQLYSGSLELTVNDVNGIYYSGLAGAVLTNRGNNALSFNTSELTSEAANAIYFGNQINLESGILNFSNDVNGQKLVLKGNITGNGGLDIEMKQNADIAEMTGTVNVGSVNISKGVLDISSANGNASDTSETLAQKYQRNGYTNLGNVTAESGSGAVLLTGEQYLQVGSAENGAFYGTIQGNLEKITRSATGEYTDLNETYASIIKVGTGTWTVALQDLQSEYNSNLANINIKEGAVNLVDSSLKDVDFYLNGSNTGLTVKDNTGDVELNGRIYSKNQAVTSLAVNMTNNSDVLHLTNTGIDSEGNSTGAGNSVSSVELTKGTLKIDTAYAKADQTPAFKNAIGNATINNSGNNKLVLNTVGSEAPTDVYFGNQLFLEKDLLTVTNSWSDGNAASQNLHFTGKISGNGGLDLNLVDAESTLYLSNSASLGATKITNGILDISEANASAGYTMLGNLTSTDTTADSKAKIVTGNQYLNVGSNEDGSFSGTILGALSDTDSTAYASIVKKGTGTWTLKLNNDGNVRDIAIQDGTLAMSGHSADNSLKTINAAGGTLQVSDGSLSNVAINLGNNGALHAVNDSSLAFLNAENTASTINIDNGVALTLEDGKAVAEDQYQQNTHYNIGSKLAGNGSLVFNNAYDWTANGFDAQKNWTISGNNAGWAGTIDLNDGILVLNSANAAGGSSATVDLADETVLRANVSTSIGKIALVDSAKLEIGAGKTVTVLTALTGKTGNTDDTLNFSYDSASSSDVGGILLLTSAVASDYKGNINVERAILKLDGNNYGEHGLLTLDGGSLSMDYSKMTYADSINSVNSLWGDGEIKVTGTGGGIVIAGTDKNVNLLNNITLDGSKLTAGSNLVLEFTNTGKATFKGDFIPSSNDFTTELQKYGTGTLVLDGDSAFNGLTYVNAGTLQLGADDATSANTQLANSKVIVTNGGTLTGNATGFQSLSLAGRFSANNFDGTNYNPINLSAAADQTALTMTAGSQIDLNAADTENYTKIVATNNAGMKFNGGTVSMNIEDQKDIQKDTAFQAFQTTGNVSGDLSNIRVLDNVTGYQLIARRSSTGVDLVFTNVNYNYNVSNAEGLAVGNYLNEAYERYAGSKAKLFEMLENGIYNVDRFQEKVSGESTLSSATAQVFSSNMLRNTVIGQIVPFTDGRFGSSSIARGQSSNKRGFTAWMNGFGASGSLDGSKALGAADLNSWGTVVGAEFGATETAQTGLFFSYGESKLDNNAGLGTLDMTNDILGGYVRWNDDFGYGMFYANLGWTDYEGNRFLDNARDLHNYKSNYDGMNWNVYLERGYTFEFAKASIQPFLGLQYTSIQQDAYNEIGNELALHMNEMNLDSLQSAFGARILTNTNRSLKGFAYATWMHEFLDTNYDGSAHLIALSETGTSFRTVGSAFGRDWLMLGLGGRFDCTERFQIFGGTDYQVNKYSSMFTGNLGGRFSW